MTINDFSKYIKVSIRTKNYNMKGEYKNLCISLMYIGKVSDKYDHKFNLEFQNLVQTFGSKHVNMIEAKPVDNSFLEGTQWILPNLQVTRNKQPDKVQIYETSTGNATIRFSNYKKLENIEEDESEIKNENIHMAFDNLDINLVEQNFDHIVDKLIEDIDLLDEEQYLAKYKTYDLGLHRISYEAMKKIILEIGVEHILGSKEYNNLLELKEESSTSGVENQGHSSRTDQPFLRPTNEQYNEKARVDYIDESMIKPPRRSRIPYLRGLEQINIPGNILNLDSVDPLDLEKTIERWEKGCVHAALMLDFINSQNMLDYFEHTLNGLVFYYLQSWKVQNPEQHAF